MADFSNRHPANVPGSYYVDDTCVDCDLCRSIAPQFFVRSESTGTTFVTRQPSMPEEITLAEEARLGCPTESIGSDGPADSNRGL